MKNDYGCGVLIVELMIAGACHKMGPGQIGYHVGFWTAFGIQLLLDIVAAKLTRR